MASQASRDRQRRAKRRRTTSLLEYLVSGGSEASRQRRPLAAYNRSLTLERLENRCLLATFTDAAPALNLVLAANENVGIISTGTAYTLTLNSGTWTGTNDAKVTGNGSATLVVTSAGLSAFTTDINITDSGSTGGDGVTFNTSQASGYFNSFNIALSNASTTSALAFNGASSFENSAALSAAANGSVVIGAGASLTSFAGSIVLEATGTNAALTAGGQVISQSGAISLEATGDATISSGITVNAGSGPITLAADVTSSGAGDDGVGTLAISAGATVTTTGTITLRGADVSIDTSSNPAVVGATRGLGTTPNATLTGLDNPNALAFDSSGNLYVANFDSSTVSKFAPGAVTPSATLTGLSSPYALAFDSSGNLYVANWFGASVSKFAPGALTPSATLTGLSNPSALAFDSSGNLYVANASGRTVSEFAPGATTASATLTGLNTPDALAFDSSGNLYVANSAGDNSTVSKFAPGATTPSASLTGLLSPQALAFDSNGNLYVESGNSVSVFAPGATTASATLTGLDNCFALAFDSSGDLFAPNNDNGTVSEFAPGATTPSATLTGLDKPYALAFDSSGNLYVTNGRGTDTVSKFAPASVTPTAAGVVIQSSVESRPMLIGGTNSSPEAGINLTSAELAQIYTTSTGTLTIGDGQQTGNITFSTATPATTPGASLDVLQFAAGAGQIILDDGAGTATALGGNGGSISITAGTGGISALSASNSSAEISTTGASVTLLTAGPIGTSSNRIQFADNANTAQQIVSIGSTTVQPSSVYLDGLGSLMLGNIFGGASSATIDVTARTNLVVVAGETINSGTSTLSLGADLTAAKTGDDGVGTLTINAGATVASSNTSAGAITLRGADVNIDTSSNPAVVGGTRVLATTPSATLTGLNQPIAVAFDSSGNLYVANSGGTTVSKFAPGATTSSATLTGLNGPGAMAFDSSGNLYVANEDGTTVSKFAPGASTASATLTGLNFPDALAFDSSGNLYVANEGGTTVSKFAPGATTSSATLTGLNEPTALAFDSSGNLYVANENANTASKFAPGATTSSATLTGLNSPFALAFDSSGNLYVANSGNGTVSKFAPGATTASATLTGLNQPTTLAFDSSGNLYVGNFGSTVSEFAPGATTASATLTGLNGARALAFDSSGNLYVANEVGTTVSKFALSATAAAGGVVIQSSVESRPMLVGGTNSSPVAGINLTTAELAQIFTTSAGTLTIGDGQQTGNITFSTATPATTAGAGLVVVQDAAGAGQVILDDGAGSGTALGGNGGSISITAGTGGITALAASDSTAEISTTGTSVTLLTAGPIGTSSNRIQFADDTNTAQQVVSIGSTTIQPSSVYLDGLGSLTLDNIIAYDPNAPIDVTARTNLVVASSGTINAGSGPILLGADLTSAETGDDGVGTLSISAGATVTTTGTITLRGADVSIDTSSNPAVVGASRALGTTASATLTGLDGPNFLAFDSSGNLYVANTGNNTVLEFAPGSTTASATLTGLNDPTFLAFDSSGDLFVANSGGTTVSEFTPGSTTPSATLTGVSEPFALAFDSSGNLYVANFGGTTVSEFTPGSTTPSATLTGLDYPQALAFDSSGNLYVANYRGTTVSEFTPGSTTPSATLAGLDYPQALAFDSSGNLFVTNSIGTTVSEFKPGSTTASATLTGVSEPFALAFDSSGNLYVANYGGTTVSEFTPGSTTPSATLTGLDYPQALAFDSSGNLFVANTGHGSGTAVGEFAPSGLTPTAGAVVIQSSLESRPIEIGGTNNAAVAGINLTTAELAQISTTSTGTVTIGDSQQTGNITFSTATPATTAGAGLVVVQAAAGAGQVVLDDGAGSSTALSGNGGSISISAGTGGITALAASDSTAEISTTGTSVTLLTSGPIGTSSNRIQFADNANTAQQVVSIGSTTIQPASVYLDGLGSLTLDNLIAYGPNAPIDITARTNLVVASSGTINAGSGPILLGADLTPTVTGDDGVGTLSISAGATVTTTGTITLRGADVSIDTSSNPAVVGATRNGFATTLIATLSGLDDSQGMAFDSSGNLYVANTGNNTVSKFAPGATTPSATLTGFAYPYALAFDSSGNLYVASSGGGTVSEFAPGASSPSVTLTGFNSPYALAFDSSGNLYVANSGGTTVSEFAPGATTPSATLTGLNKPYALAFDTSGNLYVANKGGTTVSEFAPGATTASATLTGLSEPDALAFDSSGNLYVANWGNSGTVSKFAPGATTPSATLTGLNYPVALAVDSSGNLYVANSGTGTVSEFAPGATTANATLTDFEDSEALAFDSSGNLYVTNSVIGTISEFAPSTTPAAADVVIQSSVESRPMLVGGTNSSPVAGINLTSAELAQIYTTAAGSVTIGDTAQTGNITFSTATPVTTAGAALDVIQSTAGAGQIVLDDDSGAGTGLSDNAGYVSLSPGTGGVQTTLYAAGTPIVADGITISGTLNVTLGFAPTAGTPLAIIDNTAATGDLIQGTFSNLPLGGTYPASYLGTPYSLQANYDGGDGNDLVLTEFQPGGPVLTVIGTSGADTVAITFSSAADFSVTLNGTTNSYSTENFNQIIVDGMGGGDTLTVTDPYNTGTGTFSPQTLQWNSAKFQIQANQTQNIVFDGIQNDSAVLDGDTGADVATLTTSSVELAGPQAFDNKVVGFGSAQAIAGSFSATASIDDDASGGAVVGSATQTSLSGTGYNYVASGFQHVTATSAVPTNTAQLTASTGYTASNQPGISTLTNSGGTQVIVATGFNNPQYIVQSGPVLTVTGTSGADTVAITFSSAANFSITINGATSSYSTENINQIIVHGMGGGDTLTVTDPYNTGTGTFSPQTLQWNSAKFQIQVNQTQNMVFDGIQNDSAVLDGDTGADVATLTTSSVELAGPQAFDNKLLGFGSVQVNAGSSSATATIDDDADGGAVVGSAAQTSLSGTGYNYVASGFQHVTATSAFPTNTVQLNASTGYTASNQPGTSILTNSSGTQVILATGFNNPQYIVQSGPALTVTGTIGADTVAITFSSAADFSITINGATNSYSTENINQIIVQGMGGGDKLTVTDPYNTGTGTFSPQTLQWNSAKFQIRANQTQSIVFDGIQNDSAVLDGDTGADVATLTTSSVELAGPQAFDNKVVEFGSAQAGAGSSSATATIADSGGGAVVGSATQTSLSGTGYNYVASGFQHVSATAGSPADTVQLNSSPGYTVTTEPGSTKLVNAGGTAVILAAGFYPVVQSGPVLTVAGTSGADTVAITFSSAANFSITVNGTTNSYSTQNINQIIVDGMGGGDTLTVTDPYNTGTGTFSPQTLQWNSAKFQIRVNQTQNMVFNGIQNDSAVLDGDTGSDVATLTTSSVELAGPQAFDNKLLGFGSVQVNAGSPAATATIADSGGGAVVGSATQTSLSGTGYNYMLSGFQYVSATAGSPADTVQLNPSAGYTVTTGSGSTELVSSNGTVVILATGFVSSDPDSDNLAAIDSAFEQLGN